MSEAQQDPATSRLDNFVDAAFAFALTLLGIAAAEPDFSYAVLLDAMRRIPVFAAGFALIGMFWFAHVSWRRAGGRHDTLSIVLSLMLVSRCGSTSTRRAPALPRPHPMALRRVAHPCAISSSRPRSSSAPAFPHLRPHRSMRARRPLMRSASSKGDRKGRAC